MIKYIIVFGFFVVAFVFMALSLHFSQYKKKKGSCCSSGLDVVKEHAARTESCDACPEKC